MTEAPKDNGPLRRGNMAKPVSDLLGKVLEPVMARRSGMTLDLVKAWDEIVGAEFRDHTKPERINWPRRAHEDDPFEPATLVVACESSKALFFQHEQHRVIEQVNLFFGFEAIKRMKIEQKPVKKSDEALSTKAQNLAQNIPPEDEAQLAEIVRDVDNQTLRDTLMKLGRGVMAQSR